MSQDNHPTEAISPEPKRKRRNPWQWFKSLGLIKKVLTVGAAFIALLIILPVFASIVDPDGFEETQEQVAQDREDREAKAEREAEEEAEREAEEERLAEEEVEAEQQAEREAEEQAEQESEEEAESERLADEERQEEEEDAAEANPEGQEASGPEVDYTIEIREGSMGEEAHINFDLPDGFTGGHVSSQAQRTANAALEEAYTDDPALGRYVVFVQGEEGLAANSAFEPSTLSELDFSDPELNVFEHLDAGSAHPDLLD